MVSTYLVIFGKPRYLGLVSLSEEVPLEKGTAILVQTQRGEEIGYVAGALTSDQEAHFRKLWSSQEDSSEGQSHGSEPALQDLVFRRKATEEDLSLRKNLEQEEEGILKKAKEILRGHNLAMKLVDVEYLLDRRKLFFYFTSEQRIDFRAFVRDLARDFKTRIELRQIGVRDEAKVIQGLSPCGRPCCCSYWLNRFSPICIRMVKEQNLALNPTKISGICGRLMCCMGFEYEVYRDLWKDLPSPGSKIKTPLGNYVVAGVDLAKKAVRCLVPQGGEVVVPVSQFQKFKETVLAGQIWEEKGTEEVPLPLEELLEEAAEVDETSLMEEPLFSESTEEGGSEKGKTPGKSSRRRKRRKKSGGGVQRSVEKKEGQTEGPRQKNSPRELKEGETMVLTKGNQPSVKKTKQRGPRPSRKKEGEAKGSVVKPRLDKDLRARDRADPINTPKREEG